MTRRARRPARGTGLDDAFDQLLPVELRHLSPIHWTPVRVAVRATALLGPARGNRILDVGAGVGKVCTIGALSGAGRWCGVEQHAPLVEASRRLSGALGVATRAEVVHGDAFSLDWSDFDALYFYNPFELAVHGSPRFAADRTIQIARVQRRLASLRERTRVITFHGFGGVMPPSFELLYHERIAGIGLDLAMWIQRSARGAAVAS
jgi:hypothetical protein